MHAFALSMLLLRPCLVLSGLATPLLLEEARWMSSFPRFLERGSPQDWHADPSNCSVVSRSEWLLCGQLTAPCLVFSIGIGMDWRFDDVAARKYGCEVHSFDPTRDLLSQHNKHAAKLSHSGLKIHFHPVGLGASTNYSGQYGHTGLVKVNHLDTLISQYADTSQQIDVLKIDCEVC